MRNILFLLLLLPPLARAQQVLTLEQAIRITLENNYAIKIANSQVALAENDNKYRNAGFLPIVAGNVQKTFSNTNTQQVFFPDASGNVRPDIRLSGVPGNNSTTGVNATWTIFDGFGMFVARDRLTELVRSGQANAKVTVETTVANVSNAYFLVVRQQARVSTQRDALDSISTERVRVARDRFEVGQGSKQDYLSAQVDFNTDKAALIAEEQALQNAKVALNALLVRPKDVDFVAEPVIPLRRDLSQETLREQMRRQNPSLLVAALNRRLADLDVQTQQSLLYPTVDVLGGYNYTTNNNLASTGFGARQSRNGAFTYGLRATIPILNGFNQRRLIQNSKINRLITEQQESDLRVQLDAALDQTFVNYQNSLRLIEVETQNLSIARQNVDIALERYRIGVSTPLELREAQRNVVAVQTRLIEARYNTKLAEIELQRLSSTIIQQ
jgi:outer membrane protein TolC